MNETKTAKLARVFSPLEFADDEVIEATLGCKPGAIGPNSKCAFSYADPSALGLVNFVCGANKEDTHFIDANWDDETRYDEVADIRCVQEGDISPDGKGTLAVKRGIEVGHIFQLGDKYSAALKATALDENGKSVVMSMGCYGIGVTRVVAACIEQNHDEHGIIWPENIAPYSLVIVQVDAHKSELVRTVSEEIYQLAQGLGIEVLLDDRDKKTSPGVKFADSELIGIPHRLVISPRSLADGVVEYKRRGEADKQLLASETLAGFVSSLAAGENS